MIIVTGAAGFVGSNLVRGFNRAGERDILAVDDLSDGRKFENLADCDIADYWDKDQLLERLRNGPGFVPRRICHQGACTVTTDWDGRFMMENNYGYSVALFDYCRERGVPFVYASSAAVYGAGDCFREDAGSERPLNVYGYSKLLFDRYVRRRLGRRGSQRPDRDGPQVLDGDDGGAQVVGLRYFNVYGPGESHKGPMASIAWHLHRQVREHGEARLFEGSDGYAAGEQLRDFVYVDDVVDVNLWFCRHPERSGIFNVGTGRAATFNAVADAVIAWHGAGRKRYIPFPEDLRGAYQSFTQADIAKLRRVGYARPFTTVEAGVRAYLDRIEGGERRGSARDR